MNTQTFSALLHDLDDRHWQAIVEGGALLMVDDAGLEVGSADSANAILISSGDTDARSLRADTLAHADELLCNYYLTHPLTQAGFAAKAVVLMEAHGALAFAAPEGDLPERTLFVDGGELVVEHRDSPRHRYGAFCEVELGLDEAKVTARVHKWLNSGAAHERYLEMNVCRYNC